MTATSTKHMTLPNAHGGLICVRKTKLTKPTARPHSRVKKVIYARASFIISDHWVIWTQGRDRNFRSHRNRARGGERGRKVVKGPPYWRREELGGDGGKRGVEARRKGPPVASSARRLSLDLAGDLLRLQLVLVGPTAKSIDGAKTQLGWVGRKMWRAFLGVFFYFNTF
jgi:hypothetical protein